MTFTLGGCEVSLPEGDCQTDNPDGCPASVAGHQCSFDEGDLRHFPEPVEDGTPWLLGVRHCCGCHPTPACWPEVF